MAKDLVVKSVRNRKHDEDSEWSLLSLASLLFVTLAQSDACLCPEGHKIC